MDQYLHALTYGKLILVVGDLNCNLFFSSHESRALSTLCSSLNMKQLITQPTRVTATSKSLIDVIMTCNSALIAEIGVMKTHISYHYLVYAVLNLKMPKPPPTYVIAITDIVNRSLLTSVFPSALRNSEVVPILKDGDHEIRGHPTDRFGEYLFGRPIIAYDFRIEIL